MSFGTDRKIRGVICKSEVVEWEISDFLYLMDSCKIGDYYESPPFAALGCTWNLLGFPKCRMGDYYVSVYLHKKDCVAEKTIKYAFGLKKADGSLEERGALRNYSFRKVDFTEIGWNRFLSHDELVKQKSVLTRDGTLTLTCRILEESTGVANPDVEVNPTEENPPGEMNLVALETLSSDFRDLLVSQKKFDITVNVQGKEFQAHRVVLMARSPVFRAMYEHKTSEDETGLLTIPDCDPDTFGDFLTYLYSGKLDEVTFETAYNLYTTSEKYNLQELKSFCTAYMKRNLTSENVCDVVVLADQYDDSDLQSEAQDFFTKNYRTIFPTSQWLAMLKNHHRLVHSLLNGMASAEGAV